MDLAERHVRGLRDASRREVRVAVGQEAGPGRLQDAGARLRRSPARGAPRACPVRVRQPFAKHTIAAQPLTTCRPARSRTTPSGRPSRRPQAVFFSTAVTRAEGEHPGEAAQADGEHHQHQRPAAADAEQAVGDPEPKRLAPLGPTLPVVQDEPERGAALVEAAVLERAELVERRRRRRSRPGRSCGLRGEPGDGVDGRVDAAIADPGDEPERRPHDEVAER